MDLLVMSLSNMLYIDPAATSILLTSLSGIVIAVGATAVILWRKFRKKVTKVLKIDENANKEVEDEIVLKDESATDAAAAETAVTEETKVDSDGEQK